jgi:hypothetical protein
MNSVYQVELEIHLNMHLSHIYEALTQPHE